MKKNCIFILAGFFILIASQLFAQKITSGDLSVLKGQNKISVTYDYSKMAVGKFKTEDEYIQKGIDDRNAKKPGTGDDWAVKWKAGKTERYQPSFEESFNNQASDCGLQVKVDPEAKYVFVVHTNEMEQGVETVVMGAAKSASVDLVIDLIESSAPDKTIATIEMDGAKPHSNMRMTVGGVPVNKEVYDPTIRIAECYETAGKQIGKLICKQLK
ncbi:MAG: hypothetical protein WCK09_04650 [Bacteroidota bacterium]